MRTGSVSLSLCESIKDSPCAMFGLVYCEMQAEYET